MKRQMEKVGKKMNFKDQNTNLNCFANQIQKWFSCRKFTAGILKTDGKWLVQAKKEGIWRSCTASARAFRVLIEGTPNDFTITTSTGKWINNTASLAIVTVLTGAILLPFVGIAALWTKKIEKDVIDFINTTVDFVEKNTE